MCRPRRLDVLLRCVRCFERVQLPWQQAQAGALWRCSTNGYDASSHL